MKLLKNKYIKRGIIDGWASINIYGIRLLKYSDFDHVSMGEKNDMIDLYYETVSIAQMICFVFYAFGIILAAAFAAFKMIGVAIVLAVLVLLLQVAAIVIKSRHNGAVE